LRWSTEQNTFALDHPIRVELVPPQRSDVAVAQAQRVQREDHRRVERVLIHDDRKDRSDLFHVEPILQRMLVADGPIGASPRPGAKIILDKIVVYATMRFFMVLDPLTEIANECSPGPSVPGLRSLFPSVSRGSKPHLGKGSSSY
jgi:hypothetical protein